MQKRNFNSLKEFRNNLHKGEVSVIDFENKPLACIRIDNQRYIEIIGKIAGKKLAIDVVLDIFHDGTNVFVDVNMTYLDYDIEENYLINANDNKDFFRALATSGLISILPIDSSLSNNNILMIQIPKIDAAKTAWDQIVSITSKPR
jgi:hypothetical protein